MLRSTNFLLIKFPLFSSSGDKNYYQISWEDAFDKIEKKLKKELS